MSDYLQKLFGFDGQVAVVIGGTGVLGGELCKGWPRPGPRSSSPAAAPSAATSASRRSRSSAARRRSSKSMPPTAQSVKALLDDVIEQHGRVDALVNCAGVNSPTPYFDITDEEFDRIINTQPARHAPRLPGLRQAHDRRRRRGDPQHRQRDQLPAAVAGVHLLGVEGGRAEPHAKRGPRVRAARRARELPVPRLLSRPSRTARSSTSRASKRSSATRRWAASATRRN